MNDRLPVIASTMDVGQQRGFVLERQTVDNMYCWELCVDPVLWVVFVKSLVGLIWPPTWATSILKHFSVGAGERVALVRL